MEQESTNQLHSFSLPGSAVEILCVFFMLKGWDAPKHIFFSHLSTNESSSRSTEREIHSYPATSMSPCSALIIIL